MSSEHAQGSWHGRMTREPAPSLWSYLLVAVGGALAGLATGSPELVALAAPCALVVAVALARLGDVDVRVEGGIEPARLLEGGEVALRLVLDADRRLGQVSVTALPGTGLAVAQPASGTVTTALTPGQERPVALRLRAARWGAHPAGVIGVQAPGPLGVWVYRCRIDLRLTVKVYPEAARLRRLLEPAETQLHVGNRRSRAAGGGIEYADVRVLAPGDDPRWVNWRVSARRGEHWVTERHPERNSDVVLFVDTLAEAGQGLQGTLNMAVRAAAGLAAGYLGHRDRVGVIGFGGALQWLRPGMGDVQRYRILDTLLTSKVWATYVWAGASAVPPQALPAEALIVGLSPLLDARVTEAFADLRGRGFDLVILELDPDAFLPAPADAVDRVARRWWSLERDATRARFARSGVAVARWRPDEPIARPLEEVATFRRAVRHASA